MDRTSILQRDSISKSELLSEVLAPNNFDGLKAHQDLQALA